MQNPIISSYNPKWNRLPKLNINHIEFNQDKSLLIIATNYGYRVFDGKTFKFVSKIDDYQELIGPLKKASSLYNSQFIAFLGKEGNNSCLQTQLIFWDDKKRHKLGMLILKENIINFKLFMHLIFVQLQSKILVFELAHLKYVTKITNVPNEDNLITFSNGNPLSIAFVTTLYNVRNIISISKFYINVKEKRVLYIKNFGIVTQFEGIKRIYFPEDNTSVILCVSKYQNKIHIYAIATNELLYCIFLGGKYTTISNIAFDIKMEFMLITLEYDEIKIYKLIGNKGKYNCDCKVHPDKEVKEKRKRSNSSFIGGLFAKMFQKEQREEYANFNFNESNIPFICEFNQFEENSLFIINMNGIIYKMTFNENKGKNVIVDEKIELFKLEKS